MRGPAGNVARGVVSGVMEDFGPRQRRLLLDRGDPFGDDKEGQGARGGSMIIGRDEIDVDAGDAQESLLRIEGVVRMEGMIFVWDERKAGRTCHFRHDGLKLGRPSKASSLASGSVSRKKTYSLGRAGAGDDGDGLGSGARQGSGSGS
jgi:hypothetical protein